MRHSCQKNLQNHCREWPAGKTESEIKLLIQENSKPQDLTVYTDGSVTKDQSGWGFTAKQGATTIHEDSAAYMVSTSSLTMEVEAVTHASAGLPPEVTVRPHMPSSSQIQLACYKLKSGMGNPDLNVSMVDIYLRKLLWVYCLGHAGLKGNDRVDRMAGKATLTSGLLLGRSETLRSTTCGHKAKDITPLIAWRREAWKMEALDDLL